VRISKIAPEIVTGARENRAFLGRAVRYLAGEAKVRQFLDIGTGIPTAGNTHEVAQAVAPESRVVYVDNDPIVLAHARALLVSRDEGATSFIDADLRKPGQIIAAARDSLDFSQPVALLLVAILHFIPDSDEPRKLVEFYRDALPPIEGSASHCAGQLRALLEAFRTPGRDVGPGRSHAGRPGSSRRCRRGASRRRACSALRPWCGCVRAVDGNSSKI
jgi:S-adenosyl methyltransferase